MSNPLEMTPVEFEIFVRRFLEKQGRTLTDFQTQHLEKLHGTDGDYIIDVTARFNALGGDYLVLIECKRYTSCPVEREEVQALNQKKLSIGAHKAMFFATTTFRSGAIDFAAAHGIALVQVTTDEVNYAVKSWLLPVKAHFVEPDSISLGKYLFDGQTPDSEADHMQTEQDRIQVWLISVLWQRLDYLRILLSKGYQVDEVEIEKLKMEIAAAEAKLH